MTWLQCRAGEEEHRMSSFPTRRDQARADFIAEDTDDIDIKQVTRVRACFLSALFLNRPVVKLVQCIINVSLFHQQMHYIFV